MSEVTQETLKQIQARVKALQATRDQIFKQQAAQEAKRDEAFKNLRQLGIDNPETMTAKQLQALADEKKVELEQKVQALNEQLSQGESLVAKFNELQQEG